jgi:hypothetical protein
MQFFFLSSDARDIIQEVFLKEIARTLCPKAAFAVGIDVMTSISGQSDRSCLAYAHINKGHPSPFGGSYRCEVDFNKQEPVFRQFSSICIDLSYDKLSAVYLFLEKLLNVIATLGDGVFQIRLTYFAEGRVETDVLKTVRIMCVGDSFVLRCLLAGGGSVAAEDAVISLVEITPNGVEFILDFWAPDTGFLCDPDIESFAAIIGDPGKRIARKLQQEPRQPVTFARKIRLSANRTRKVEETV